MAQSFWPEPGAAVRHADAHGTFRVSREPNGVYAALVDLDTQLGHISAVIALDPSQGASLEHMTHGGVITPPPELGPVVDQADQYAAQLDAAAIQRGTAPAVLRVAKLYLRAHLGDERAKESIHGAVEAAKAGDPSAAQQVRLIKTAREFAREVVGVQVTGNLFGHLGSALSHAVKSIGHDITHPGQMIHGAVQDVVHFDRRILKPTLHALKQWGPMILSDLQGVISMIPGIGTGISAAISAGVAILSGGGLLSVAIHAAYGAIPIPPGIRPICDVVLDTVMELVKHPKNLVDAGLAVMRDRLPKGLPQQIFDTLIHIVAKHHPVLKATQSVAAHAIGQYTAGEGPNLTHAVSTVLPPEVAGHLAKLPDPSVQFASIHKIAPHFAINPHDASMLIAHAQRASGVELDPDHARALAVGVAQAAVANAQQQAALRVAQRQFVQPRVPPPSGAPPASLAIQVSPDGQAARVHASDALSGVAQTVAPGAAL